MAQATADDTVQRIARPSPTTFDRGEIATATVPPRRRLPSDIVGGGELSGVAAESQEQAWKKELASQQLELRREGRRSVAYKDLDYTRGIDRPRLSNGDSYDALKAESDSAQNRLPVNEPLQSAFSAQVPQNLQARAARFGQLQAQRQAKAGKIAGQSAFVKAAAQEMSEFVNAAYKRAWQMAQEAAEDTALSFGDFMLLSGPIVIALYGGRWVLGNMMGDLFTREIKPPVGPALAGISPAITVKLIPGYSIGDMTDYVRHMKFILVLCFTLMVYGFLTIVLYYTFNPTELAKLGWAGFQFMINLLVTK